MVHCRFAGRIVLLRRLTDNIKVRHIAYWQLGRVSTSIHIKQFKHNFCTRHFYDCRVYSIPANLGDGRKLVAQLRK